MNNSKSFNWVAHKKNYHNVIKGGKLEVKSKKDIAKTPYIQTLELELESIEKGGFEHFMLKEIYEQGKSINDCLRGRVFLQENDINSKNFSLTYIFLYLVLFLLLKNKLLIGKRKIKIR